MVWTYDLFRSPHFENHVHPPDVLWEGSPILSLGLLLRANDWRWWGHVSALIVNGVWVALFAEELLVEPAVSC